MSYKEGERVAALCDADLLSVIRARATDLRAAEACAGLVRVFEHAIRTHPDLAKGIHVCVGLTKLYSQQFEPGNPAHPFPGFALQVGEILAGAVDPMPARSLAVQPERRKDVANLLRQPKAARVVEGVLKLAGPLGKAREVYARLSMPEVKEHDVAQILARMRMSGMITREEGKGYVHV